MGEVIGAPTGQASVLGRVSPQRWAIAAALVVLNVVDVVLTRAVLDRGGVEINPLMQSMMAGLAAPLGLKTLVAGTAAVLLLLCPPEARLGERAAAAVAGLYVAIVAWNATVLAYLQLV